ncbi:MAG: hypothetical protein JEY96_06190 [Bacteroidales bacterium]|jgi:hypothetical protein|nr:hypothetical protein [Bacteroidales bacterium]
MVKNSTLLYIYSNFEESNIITEGSVNYVDKEYEDIRSYLDGNLIKAPAQIVSNVLRFSKKYS